MKGTEAKARRRWENDTYQCLLSHIHMGLLKHAIPTMSTQPSTTSAQIHIQDMRLPPVRGGNKRLCAQVPPYSNTSALSNSPHTRCFLFLPLKAPTSNPHNISSPNCPQGMAIPNSVPFTKGW